MLNYIKLFLVSKKPQTYQVIPTGFFLKTKQIKFKRGLQIFFGFYNKQSQSKV